MWLNADEIYDVLMTFLTAGGPVISGLILLSLLLWSLLLERIWFAYYVYPRRYKDCVAQKDRFSHSLIYSMDWIDLRLDMQAGFTVIRSLIAICPLVGLLGTVTGMIELFDILAWNGTGNPRLMAAGVARATLPTLGGMVLAVSGLLVWNRLARWRDLKISQLEILGARS